jgi:hypothetical protein
MQVKEISLDFLGTFFIKEKGTKHIFNPKHPGKPLFIKEKVKTYLKHKSSG